MKSSGTPTLLVSDSGIRMIAPAELAKELFHVFQDAGISTVIQSVSDHRLVRIIFPSPYTLDGIVSTFQTWQSDHEQAERGSFKPNRP